MIHPKLQNRRSAVLQRCSTPGQADNSIDNQNRAVEAVVRQNSIAVVLQIDLEGVSGSIPGNRTDVDEIIERKITRDDFDMLIVPSCDRFTRAGSGHGQKLLYELEAAGIVVYFVAEKLFSDDELSRVYLSFLFEAARQTAKAISRVSTAGSTNSFLDGRSPYTRRIPIGLDRMYFVGDKPMHIIRNLPDGTQLMLDPKNREKEIRTFERNPQRGTPAHYKKQKNERIVLIPGEEHAIALVSLIMRMRWVQGLGARQICRFLNDRETPAPCGGEWAVSSVETIYLRPIYIGNAIRARRWKGIYHKAAIGSPVETGVSIKDLASSKQVKAVRRPRSQWLEKPQPHLFDFLPEDVRDAAKLGIESHLDRIASGQPLQPDKNKHKDSSYILTGTLRSRDANLSMMGNCGGTKAKPTRYYVESRSIGYPSTLRGPRLGVPAEPLEQAVIGLVCDLMMARSDLKQIIASAVSNVKSSDVKTDPKKIDSACRALRAQQDALTRQLIGDVALDQSVHERLREIAIKLKALMAGLRTQQEAMPDLRRGKDSIEKMLVEFSETARTLMSKDRHFLRGVIKLVVGRLSVDLERRDAEIDLAVPSWIATSVASGRWVGLVSAIGIKIGHENNRLLVRRAKLTYRWKSNSYDVRFVKAA